MGRNPVFSHEELVCKMAADPDGLDLDLAKAVYDEMVAIVEREANRRHILKRMVCWNLKQYIEQNDEGYCLIIWTGDLNNFFSCL